MIVWESVRCAADARPWPVGKPWRVTRYLSHWYWGYPISPVGVFDFRWYWQANVASWFWHHVLGWSCNTWFRKEPAIKQAEGENT